MLLVSINIILMPTLYFFNKFIYLYLAVLGLCYCVRLSLVVVSGGYSSLQRAGSSLPWLLIAEHRL